MFITSHKTIMFTLQKYEKIFKWNIKVVIWKIEMDYHAYARNDGMNRSSCRAWHGISRLEQEIPH